MYIPDFPMFWYWFSFLSRNKFVKNYMACNGPTLDWTGPTEKLWILGQPTSLPLNYWLLIFWGERQSLDSELGIHHRLLVWGKLISAQSGRSNILKVVLGSCQIHKSTVKNCGSVWPQGSRGWGATGGPSLPLPGQVVPPA